MSEMASPHIKVCGITRPEDALLAVELGADVLGLNFWPGSSRCLEAARAREIADRVRGRALLAGVFVNQEPAAVARIDEQVGLDLVQLHGEEPAAQVQALGRRALKVFRLRRAPDPRLLDDYPEAWGFLFELRHESYGGSGRTWDYSSIAGLTAAAARPMLVAGGIGPDTAGAALAASGADGIDVCSGVEAAPGVKDPRLLRRLFERLRRKQSDGEASTATG